MKRIMLSAFAAAITAAWVVPASAGDITFSGQHRIRGEYVTNADYDDNLADATDKVEQRVRLTANANATDDTSVKVTIQDSRVWGDSTQILTDGGSDKLDLHEAYVNIKNVFGTPIAVRAGRQELNYGDQRLIGSFGWSNQGRAFEGVKLSYNSDQVDADFFRMNVSEGTTSTKDSALMGVYATLKGIIPNNTLDVYAIHQSDEIKDGVRRNTIGARLKGAVAGVDYTAELPYQTGELSATNDIDAYAFALKVGYTLPTPLKIRIGAEYDYGTGDEAGSTTENENFTNLYPTNHGHFGIADVVNSWTDTTAWSINVSAQVNEQLKLYAAYWDFTETEGTTNNSDEKGNEVDLIAKYKYNSNVALEVGASRFTPGDATQVTPDDPKDKIYVMLTTNF